MGAASHHVAKLIAFLALPPRARIDALVASGWAVRHDLEERTTTKQLLGRLDSSTGTLRSYEPWAAILETESVVFELESLLNLIFVVSDRFESVELRLFDSVEAMETEPEWRLVWRLVAKIAELLNIVPSIKVADVPGLICGGEVA